MYWSRQALMMWPALSWIPGGDMLQLLYALACLGTLQAHPQQQRADPTTVTVPLREVFENGQQWFVGDMAVGTPGQPMTVIVAIDGITLVNSVRCTDPYCTSHSQYDASASSTYQEDGTPFSLPTGLNISGIMSADSVTVGGVTVSGLPFGEATNVWNDWSLQAPQDGVLGLGFSPDTAQYSILVSMATQGLIPAMKAGVWLGRGSVGGELTLGGVNEDRYVGELTWAPIVDSMAAADSVTLGDVDLCGGQACLVGATSGSPYFFMTMQAAKTVNDALGGIDIGEPGVAALDCATLDSLPDLVTVIQGRTLTMTARQYTFFIPLADGTQMCLSGFVGIPDAPPTAAMTVGTLFLQQFYSVYDMENMQVGFSESAE